MHQILTKLGQILTKFCQTWNGPIRVQMCMENHVFPNFCALVCDWQNQQNRDFAKTGPSSQLLQNNDFPCTFAPLLDHFRFDKIWSIFGQVWSKFGPILASKNFSFDPKMGFGIKHWIPKFQLFRSNGSKVIPLGAFQKQRPIILWPCDL